MNWARRKEFVNAVLVLGASYDDIEWEDIELDGVAGEQFDKTVELAEVDPSQVNVYIKTAIKFEVPVEGLEADGEFGEKWAEVIALAKQKEDVEHDAPLQTPDDN